MAVTALSAGRSAIDATGCAAELGAGSASTELDTPLTTAIRINLRNIIRIPLCALPLPQRSLCKHDGPHIVPRPLLSARSNWNPPLPGDCSGPDRVPRRFLKRPHHAMHFQMFHRINSRDAVAINLRASGTTHVG